MKRAISMIFLPLVLFEMILLFFFGCTFAISDYNKVLTFIEKRNSTIDVANLKAVFVLTDVECVNCNKSFALFSEQFLNRPDCVWIVASTGVRYDISPFRDIKNVIFNVDEGFSINGILTNTGVILLDVRNEKIDTIIHIDAKHIDESFDFLMHEMVQHPDSLGSIIAK